MLMYARELNDMLDTEQGKLVQGMLPLTFADPADYDKVGPRDKISIVGLPPKPSTPLTVKGTTPDGANYELPVNHTFNDNQITWFKHGSALNAMGAKASA